MGTQIEVGAQDGMVILMVTVPDADGVTAERTRIPLTLDEARNIVNGMGEAIRFLARS